MECKFTVGQKVTPRDAMPWLNHFGVVSIGGSGPAFGEVCTILAMRPSRLYSSQIMLKLAGYVAVFDQADFRPLHETQIEDLRKIAIDAFQKAKSGHYAEAFEPYTPGSIR